MKSSREKLFKIVDTQQGFFTAQQAVQAGYQTTHHTYHVKKGNWIREYRGIYRLSHFPQSEEWQLVLFSLWSANKQGEVQGVYSHETALVIYNVSDVNPHKLHMSVPLNFRRSSRIPVELELHKKKIKPEDFQQRAGYRVTTPLRTILDLIRERAVDDKIIRQAISEFSSSGKLVCSDLTTIRQVNSIYNIDDLLKE